MIGPASLILDDINFKLNIKTCGRFVVADSLRIALSYNCRLFSISLLSVKESGRDHKAALPGLNKAQGDRL